MSNFRYFRCVVFILFILPHTFTQPGPDFRGSRRRRHAPCSENAEYLYNNICCTNCPAGKYMKSPCTRAGEMGECEECDSGTYTEHSNGLKQCFKCTQCRPDQEIVRQCTQTQDTECQCKVGGFCAPDQACEVCRKCLRCEMDEEIVRNCTPTTNTECKKIQSESVLTSANSLMIWITIPLAGVILIVGIIFWWKRHRPTDSQRTRPDGLKAGEHYTEERRNEQTQRLSFPNMILSRQPVRAKSSAAMEDELEELCDSLSSSASNSQHNITIAPSSVFPTSPPQACPVVPRQHNNRDEEKFPTLIPVNGLESLRECFQYFEDMDFDYHKRFFRHLGIIDNVIKSKEHLLYEDKIHELLNIWVEKKGRDASLNDLLKALLDLNQRRTAETVKDNAIEHGHYTCENEFSELFSENM